MLMAELTSAGAIPVLEATLQFAGARQKLIAHNIANATTPDFRVRDVEPAKFAQVLRDAVNQRRQRNGGSHGSLQVKSSREIDWREHEHGGPSMKLTPRSLGEQILFHDRNDRDIERLMQDNAENVAVYRVTAELLRSRYDLLRSAIAERAG